MSQMFPAEVPPETMKHFVKIGKVCPIHELYDCVENTVKPPKSPRCISAIQEITSFFKRIRDKLPIACNDTTLRKQQKEKLRKHCKYNLKF